MDCKLWIALFLALGVAACVGDASGPSDSTSDEDTSGDDGSDDIGTPAGSETCDNAVDDDGDGLVDENCTCTPGEVMSCFTGPLDRVNVGVCTGGSMTCVDNGEFSAWDGVCAGEVLPAADDVPGNGLDDDCDGVVDTGGFGLCPDGGTPTFHDRDFPPGYAGSSIDPGDGEPIQTMTCEASTCASDEVAVDLEDCASLGDDPERFDELGADCGRKQLCVAPPPECADGTFPTYRDPAGWSCEPPCEIIVSYGGIYGGERRCASNPDLSCPPEEVPTFTLEGEVWECRPTCDNGLYDQHYIDGQMVCVPC